MSFLSSLKADVAAIPSEVEQIVEDVLTDAWVLAKPILAGAVEAATADIAANASNPAALITTAASIATGALPSLETAGITAVGTTVLGWVLNLLNGHPAVVSAQPAAAPAA